MNNLNTRDVVIILLCVIICLGASMFFQPCGPRDDDSWMVCHWAGQVVIGLGGVMSVIALARFFVNAEVQKGLSLALIPLAMFTAYLPNNIIPLCKMETMQCQAIFKPSVLLISALIIFSTVANIFFNRKANR